MARASVRVNVYDMYWLNEYASPLGVGVFHAGIEVYGVEYAFGGHPFAFSGIFELSPQSADELGENFRFREAIVLGETDFSASEIRRIVQQMGLDYRGDQYHLINKNCNHFSDALAKTLTGREIPAWINRLANFSAAVPFISRMIPSEWLTPIALQQSLDSRSGSVAAAVSSSTERKSNNDRGGGGTTTAACGSSSTSSTASSTTTSNGSITSSRSTTANSNHSRTVNPVPARESGAKRCSQ